MTPFERRLKVLQYSLKHEKGEGITLNDLLDNNVVEINQASLNSLLKRLVRDGYLTSKGEKTYTRYYKPTQKTKESIKA